ncbi:MAG: glycosyltransferase family 2 protein [Gemmatimonadota bacterium]|nr:glycosyltransferase family 2 protein [Gemmatimonadota bacterium]
MTAEGRASFSGQGVPDLSIVIVNRNTCDLLKACLASLAAEDRAPETIVVDNDSTDGSVELVRFHFPQITLIRNSENTGYARANNQGIAAARGRHVLLLNSDTEVRAGALDRLVEYLETNSRVGACGPLLRYPSGRVQPSCFSFPTPRTLFAQMSGLDAIFPRNRLFGTLQRRAAEVRDSGQVEALLGAALLVRREALEAVGGLDEELRIHYNDFDWCYRMHRAGWEVHFVADAEVLHHSEATTRLENRGLALQGEIVRNLFAYYEKHFGERGVRWARLWMSLGFGGRYLAFRALGAFRPAVSDPQASRFRLGMARAAWTGDPEQFGGPTSSISSNHDQAANAPDRPRPSQSRGQTLGP